mgnify:CR=1 FL=1
MSGLRIDVDTKDKVVTLTGTVKSAAQVAEADARLALHKRRIGVLLDRADVHRHPRATRGAPGVEQFGAVGGVGGEQARIVGNRGGLDPKDNAVYACRYLWAIQLSDAEPVRFIKVDEEGEEVAWTETLEELLPFALSEDAFAPEDDTDEDDDEDDDDSPEPGVHGHTLH